MHEWVGGFVRALTSSVDRLMQFVVNKNSSTEKISFVKKELNATHKPIDELKLLAVFALNKWHLRRRVSTALFYINYFLCQTLDPRLGIVMIIGINSAYIIQSNHTSAQIR